MRAPAAAVDLRQLNDARSGVSYRGGYEENTGMTSTKRRPLVLCVYAVGIAVAALLLVQHWVHIPQLLPYLVLLACPLMHLFMHKGHGGHAHSDERK
jgi:hypothetical protein